MRLMAVDLQATLERKSLRFVEVVGRYEGRRKHQYDRRSKELDLKAGNWVMVYMPQEKKGKS